MTNQDAVGSRSAAETRKASGDGPGVGRGGRMSRQAAQARRRRSAAAWRGPGDSVPRAGRVTAATPTGWREAFLAAGEASLATRPADGEELESGRPKARLGEMLLERGLLEAKIATLEGKRPLDRRRSRR